MSNYCDKSCGTCFFEDRDSDSSPCCSCSMHSLWKPKDFDFKKHLETVLGFNHDQTAKADAGKPDLTLVPRQIIWDIAAIREYGNKKYGSPDNWKEVEPERYRAAAMRHMMAYLDDPIGVDEESGKPHLWHLACNIAFLCEMEAWNDNTTED